MTDARNRSLAAASRRRPRGQPCEHDAAYPSGVRALMAEVGLVANDGLIMGGTGNPRPDSAYLSSVESLYLSQRRWHTTICA